MCVTSSYIRPVTSVMSLRTVHCMLQLPRHRFSDLVATETLSSLTCRPSRPAITHSHLLPVVQTRSYYYFPVSFEEFKERFIRWMEKAEQRFVKVKLLSRQSRQYRLDQVRGQLHRLPVVDDTQQSWNDWFQKPPKGVAGIPLAHSPLPLPQINGTDQQLSDPEKQGIRAQYLGWKSRRKEQYQGWKSRRKEQYLSWKKRRKEQFLRWKVRRQEQYRGWKQRRQLDWIRSKQIVLHEYSRPEWFDKLGRPLTSKDSIGRYVNPWRSQSTNGLHSVWTILKWRCQRFLRYSSQIGGAGSLIPVLPWNSETSLDEVQGTSPPLPKLDDRILTMTWVGHSTCWIQIQGFTVLTDPIFSVRSSPYQTLPIGVAREKPPSHSINDLVSHAGGVIDFCCITHDHYDHMDRDSVLQLSPFVDRWVVPLGIGSWLVERGGVKEEAIVELEWWQQASFRKTMLRSHNSAKGAANTQDNRLTITCCPASHWSSRTMFDRNHRLWCSFAVESPSYRLFFCGDTGYPDNFPLFRQIADALGPFDLSCIPIGAYEPSDLNKEAHVNPSEAVQIHKDLMSRRSVPIHWGTFALGEEPMHEPPQALLVSMQEQKTLLPPFEVLPHGGTIQLDHAFESANFQSESIVTEAWLQSSVNN